MPPMVRLAPHVPQGLVATEAAITADLVEHYAARARAGAGLIIVEATCVHPSGRVWKQGLNAFEDAHCEGLAEIADAISSAGAVPGVQLVHGGPQADADLSGGRTYGPSEVAPSVGAPEPTEMSSAVILEIEESFIDAAVRVCQAGFRFIELHAAHGYLLDSFISPIRNHRKDAFGGSLDNRMRMITDILLRLRPRIGETAAIGARVSVFNHIADGFGTPELHGMVRVLQDAGSDFVDLSIDRVLRPALGSSRSMGQAARDVTHLPVIVTGGISTPADAELALVEGHGDIVGVGRAMLADPEWPARAIEALSNA